MMINTENIVAMTEANQNFSKVVRIVDEKGMAVIMKNNKPKYILVDFEEYDDIQLLREVRTKKISEATDQLIDENLEAFLELAK
ncbi:type II toxin-antitoxin system prevent-host-death family antitoxin [Tannockella kyphosi]|uniref:type II toxin-antitoxin system prevent-host-death family antitoxin n=1 Tax=Tannockella kyphosi TaxID=2899121 RepID=UPI0020139251|nr:type II toxin-antitoxin system prevent-host-death family antitoxin [Tannockella kyphosi]